MYKNIYIVYEINLWPYKLSSEFTLANSLFGAAKFTKSVEMIIRK